MKEKRTEKLSENIQNIPIYSIHMMTDDEWNRLAYRNMLERQAKSNVRTA